MSAAAPRGDGPLTVVMDGRRISVRGIEMPPGEYERLKAAQKRPHKYKAVATEYNGVKYPSKHEAADARRLDTLVAGKALASWRRGVECAVTLVAGAFDVRITYIPDFECTRLDGSTYLLDSKGMRTPVFQLKVRLLRKFRPDLELWLRYADGTETCVSGPPYFARMAKRRAAGRRPRSKGGAAARVVAEQFGLSPDRVEG